MSVILPVELITSKIYFIRGVKVLLDRDLAELYDVETRVLNQGQATYQTVSGRFYISANVE